MPVQLFSPRTFSPPHRITAVVSSVVCLTCPLKSSPQTAIRVIFKKRKCVHNTGLTPRLKTFTTLPRILNKDQLFTLSDKLPYTLIPASLSSFTIGLLFYPLQADSTSKIPLLFFNIRVVPITYNISIFLHVLVPGCHISWMWVEGEKQIDALGMLAVSSCVCLVLPGPVAPDLMCTFTEW